MSELTLDVHQLTARPQSVARVLRPLGQGQVACSLVPRKVGRYKIVSAHDGAASNTDFRQRMFRTCAATFWCQYFEYWLEGGDGRTFTLTKSYLNGFHMNAETHAADVVFCVHCDLDQGCRYRKGPHLHVKSVRHPIPAGHFLLCQGVQEDVLSSLGSLDAFLASAVEMVRSEVLLAAA